MSPFLMFLAWLSGLTGAPTVSGARSPEHPMTPRLTPKLSSPLPRMDHAPKGLYRVGGSWGTVLVPSQGLGGVLSLAAPLAQALALAWHHSCIPSLLGTWCSDVR